MGCCKGTGIPVTVLMVVSPACDPFPFSLCYRWREYRLNRRGVDTVDNPGIPRQVAEIAGFASCGEPAGLSPFSRTGKTATVPIHV
jgi:hypothetical protein